MVAELGRGPNCNELIDHREVEPLAGMAFLNGFPVAVEKIVVAERRRLTGGSATLRGRDARDPLIQQHLLGAVRGDLRAAPVRDEVQG